MKRQFALLGVLGLTAGLATGPARAGEEHEHAHPNEVALVIAGTYENWEEETFFTLGAEYERRLAGRWGFKAGMEYLFDADALVLAFPVVFNVAEGLKLGGGPGVELKSRRGGDGHEEEGHEEEGGEALFLMRVGVGYSFKVGERYSIAPMVNLDFVKEEHEWVEAVVFGVGFGFGF